MLIVQTIFDFIAMPSRSIAMIVHCFIFALFVKRFLRCRVRNLHGDLRKFMQYDKCKYPRRIIR